MMVTRGMLRSGILVLLIAMGPAAFAEDKCAPSVKPTACFVDSARSSLAYCQLLVPLSIRANNPDFSCIEQGLVTIDPLYQRALKSTKEKATVELLKDFYAAWRAAMQGIRPEMDEIVIAYKTRQSSAAKALDVKAERLKL